MATTIHFISLLYILSVTDFGESEAKLEVNKNGEITNNIEIIIFIGISLLL